MKMKQPTTLADLASQVRYKTFSHLTEIGTLLEDGTAGSEFFDLIKGDFIKLSDPDTIPRYIPIIQEVVSTKKHQYNLKTHIVFWLGNGQPYIYTPKPTVLHKRVGRSLKETKMGEHLMIPHNCSHFLVVAIKEGCRAHDDPKCDDKIPFIEASITEYKK